MSFETPEKSNPCLHLSNHLEGKHIPNESSNILSVFLQAVLRDPDQPLAKPDGEKSPDDTDKGGRAGRHEQHAFLIELEPTPALLQINLTLLTFLRSENDPLSQTQKRQGIQPSYIERWGAGPSWFQIIVQSHHIISISHKVKILEENFLAGPFKADP